MRSRVAEGSSPGINHKEQLVSGFERSRKSELRWLLRQLRPFWPSHLVSVLMMVLSSLMFLLDPLLIKWLIDTAFPKRNFRLLLFAAAAFFVIYGCRTGFSALSRLVSFRTVQKLALGMRLQILEQMNRLSADYHETTPVGQKVYRMEQDVDQVAELGSSLVPSVLQTSFNTIFVIGTMSFLNLRLTCILLPLMPLFFFFRRYYELRLRLASQSAQNCSSEENSFLQEHLSHVIQVQLLGQEAGQSNRFLDRATARMSALNHRAFTEILFSVCYLGAISLGAIGVLAYGGYQVFIGALTVGGLVAFYSYVTRLFEPLNVAVDVYSRLNRLSSSISRIVQVLGAVPSVIDDPTAVDLPSNWHGRVDLQNVTFTYGNGRLILKELNFRISPGEKVALVGASGSGKSTIAKLIARLYDVDAGCVEIDGMDIRKVCLASLRSRVCYLMQDPVIFDRSLKENLLLGNPRASREDLLGAVEIADLSRVVDRLPMGWDTAAGPKGNTLSGGERQRLALARAILQKPHVMLLDESTSALDLRTEQRIFSNLKRHFREQTILFVSHRLSSLTWVDRIIVLSHGQIQESGSHQDLMDRSGPYRQMYCMMDDHRLGFFPFLGPSLAKP